MTIETTIRPILLWGMMGVGKTTVGGELAECLDRPFFDLDDVICCRMNTTIARFFEERGEDAFRILEKECLVKLMNESPTAIIALGGGSLLDSQFRQEVREACRLITLEASIATLQHRLENDSERPLLGDGSLTTLRTLLDTRGAAYADVDHRVLVDGLSPAQIAENIASMASTQGWEVAA